MWAVSQATFMRRMKLDSSIYLHDDFGWASGGFIADTVIEGLIDSGTQQQWLSRNSSWDTWLGQNWNMVFVGIDEGKAPTGTWPGTKYTTVEKTPIIKEKPYLVYKEYEGFGVYVPDLSKNSSGVSWLDGEKGEFLSISNFHVAKANQDNSKTMNQALKEGKNLILTPGIYEIDEPLLVENSNTIVLGMGLATLIPTKGNLCIKTEDVDGVIIAGILFDAGPIKSETLLEVGAKGSKAAHKENPILLSDVFFRVGGAASYPAMSKSCIVINSNDVIGDNFWVWRADHGEQVAWDINTGENGIIVNGDDVTIYGLFVEHFQEYQTIWNGNGGRTYFYQSEIPYDVPSQDKWKSHNNKVNGYASYKVAKDVTSHEAWGLGIYLYNRDASVELYSAMEVPDREGVRIHNVCTVMITGNPGITHIINESGNHVYYPGAREVIVEYENGYIK